MKIHEPTNAGRNNGIIMGCNSGIPFEYFYTLIKLLKKMKTLIKLPNSKKTNTEETEQILNRKILKSLLILLVLACISLMTACYVGVRVPHDDDRHWHEEHHEHHEDHDHHD
jgi:hypothetical protein